MWERNENECHAIDQSLLLEELKENTHYVLHFSHFSQRKILPFLLTTLQVILDDLKSKMDGEMYWISTAS